MTDTELYNLIDNAFADVPRPVHFTDFSHCYECENHDRVLRAKFCATLAMEDVGNPGWDPICFVTPEGFRYYFAALVRLALTEKDACYLTQFLFHVSDPDNPVQHFACFTQSQKELVLTVLDHISKHHSGTIELCGDEDELLVAISQWEEFIAR